MDAIPWPVLWRLFASTAASPDAGAALCDIDDCTDINGDVDAATTTDDPIVVRAAAAVVDVALRLC